MVVEMAEKRMFTQKIIDSDAFLDMPLSTQALYFHLNMRADDDGFVNNPKRIQRTIGASEDDLKLLIVKRFVICFENGVIVIKHWRMQNTLRKDRYTPTQYQEELSRLKIKENKSYTEKLEDEELPEFIESTVIDEKDRKETIENFFEKLWTIYPLKKGKGQISYKQKARLYKIGETEMLRAISRYKDELEKDKWRKAQNGSTFFNNGYIDYLDNNYVPNDNDEKLKRRARESVNNKFNDFEQRNYNYDELEKELLSDEGDRDVKNK